MTILHHIGQFLREMFAQIPITAIRILFVALLVLLLVWVLRLPNQDTTPPDEKATWSNNLKTWAAVAILFQIAIYSIF